MSLTLKGGNPLKGTATQIIQKYRGKANIAYDHQF